MYFVLADLSGIDVMYQFSLDWFQAMFTAAISGVMSVKEHRRLSTAGTVLVGTPRRGSMARKSSTEKEPSSRRSSVDKDNVKRFVMLNVVPTFMKYFFFSWRLMSRVLFTKKK